MLECGPLCVETVPHKTDPQMVHCIMGEKSWLNLFVRAYSRNKEFYSYLLEGKEALTRCKINM
jgi:hypothetical protein